MTTPKPYHNMAISLSGGGYRATTFHLGALSLLNALEKEGEPLLEKEVKILSTISGGTLTGVMYAQKLAEGGDYYDCFGKIYPLLTEDKLVEQALHKLNHPGKWRNNEKSRDIINAFAEVYNEHFYEGSTFADILDNQDCHLTDIIFGASEFTSGFQFRFQDSHDGGLFGNYYLNLCEEAVREIRLADAAASSSCFPGGFEPMIMPKDYITGPGSPLDQEWAEKGYPRTAVMDGGILDNQGIKGVQLAEDRHVNSGAPFVGTYIISDVSSRKMVPLPVPMLQHSRLLDFFTFQTVNLVALVLLAGLVALLVFGSAPVWAIVATSSLLTIIAAWFLLFFGVRGLIHQQVRKTFAGEDLPEILRDFGFLTNTPLYILAYLVKLRVVSVEKMVMDLFLRRIRRLQLSALFDNQNWAGRLQTNNIYTLEHAKGHDMSPAMEAVITLANTMPTTLWFSQKNKDDGMLDSLIACGQISLCYNLKQYNQQLRALKMDYRGSDVWSGLSATEKEVVDEMDRQLEVCWQKFREDPFWLLKEDIARAEKREGKPVVP